MLHGSFGPVGAWGCIQVRGAYLHLCVCVWGKYPARECSLVLVMPLLPILPPLAPQQGGSVEQSLVEVDTAYRLMYNLAADLWCEAWLLFKRARREGTLLVAPKVGVGRRRGGEGPCWSHPK